MGKRARQLHTKTERSRNAKRREEEKKRKEFGHTRSFRTYGEVQQECRGGLFELEKFNPESRWKNGETQKKREDHGGVLIVSLFGKGDSNERERLHKRQHKAGPS